MARRTQRLFDVRNTESELRAYLGITQWGEDNHVEEGWMRLKVFSRLTRTLMWVADSGSSLPQCGSITLRDWTHRSIGRTSRRRAFN